MQLIYVVQHIAHELQYLRLRELFALVRLFLHNVLQSFIGLLHGQNHLLVSLLLLIGSHNRAPQMKRGFKVNSGHHQPLFLHVLLPFYHLQHHILLELLAVGRENDAERTLISIPGVLLAQLFKPLHHFIHIVLAVVVWGLWFGHIRFIFGSKVGVLVF